MKNLTTLSLFIFGVMVAAILTAGLVFYQNKNQPVGVNISSENSTGQERVNGQALNPAQIAGHNKLTDCWLIIDNKVYDVSSFINLHPGGSGEIVPYCGKDATQAFKTKGGEGSHSGAARDMLNDYYLGQVGEALDQPVDNKPAVSSPKPLAAPVIAKPSLSGQIALTSKIVAAHNKSSDCWVIINSKIYNVTTYLKAHPGGAGAITSYCGHDATQAFITKGGKGSHSANAHNILASYYIGDLNQTASQNQINSKVNATTSIAPPTGQGEDEEENETEDEEDD